MQREPKGLWDVMWMGWRGQEKQGLETQEQELSSSSSISHCQGPEASCRASSLAGTLRSLLPVPLPQLEDCSPCLVDSRGLLPRLDVGTPQHATKQPPSPRRSSAAGV